MLVSRIPSAMQYLLGFRLVALVAAFGVAGLASSAQAGFLDSSSPPNNFTGFTQFGRDVSGALASNSDGVVNFAVYQNTGSNWASDLGLSPVSGGVGLADNGLPASVDLGAKYVYFYEVVNTDPLTATADPALSILKLDFKSFQNVPGQFVPTSAGYVTNTVFQDAGGSVGPAGNRAIGGTEPGTGSGSVDSINGIPSGLGSLASSPFASQSTAREPNSMYFDSVSIGATEFLEFDWIGANKIPTGQFSSIVFFTSNDSPGYGKGNIRDGDPQTYGDLPVPGPEPSAAVLWAIGGIGIAGAGWYRRRLHTGPLVA